MMVATAAMLVGTPAMSGDWSIQAVISNEANFVDNRALNENSKGISFGHISNLELDFLYAMPDGSFNISTDLSSTHYLGDAASGFKDQYLPHLGAEWIRKGRNDTITVFADYRIQQLTLLDLIESTIILPEPIFIPVDTVRTTLSGGFNWSHNVDARDTLTFRNLINAKFFDTAPGIDDRTVANTLSWERKLTKRTIGTMSAGFDWVDIKDTTNTNRFIYRLNGKLTSQLSKRLTASVGAGVNLVDTVRDGSDPAPSITGAFNTNLTYSLKTTTLSWNADYGLAEGALGDIQNSFSTGVSVQHLINDRSSVNATAKISAGEGEFGEGLGSAYTFSFSPTYSLSLTDEWKLRAGYRFVYKDTGAVATDPKTGAITPVDPSKSSTVFVTLTRAFTVLP